ncbi:MAG: hypothetical protein EXS67_05365 [Candidatus Margulisbacteria bacterium]|nr:hypothetical protein [Candidatus Margulisiibacteriota bacterium]
MPIKQRLFISLFILCATLTNAGTRLIFKEETEGLNSDSAFTFIYLSLDKESFKTIINANEVTRSVTYKMGKLQLSNPNYIPQQQQVSEMITTLTPERNYQLVSKDAPCNRWICNHYKVYSKEDLIEEVWTVSLTTLGLQAADFTHFTQLSDATLTLLQSQINGIIPGIHIPFPEPSVGNFPIKRIRYKNGKPTQTTTLVKAEQKQLKVF